LIFFVTDAAGISDLRIRSAAVAPSAAAISSILVAGNGWDRYRLANREYFDDYVRRGFPMGRLGTAEEVADVANVKTDYRARATTVRFSRREA
jgi:NAD(P)-dependent dehydrogenase (short-subunit alcohol dehydrogenase family)